MIRPDGPSSRSERGAALLMVLWLSVLLSVLMLGVAALAQSQLRTARIGEQRLHSDEALQSALDIVAFDMALVGRTALNDLPRTVTVGEHRVLVSMAGAQRALDINMANDEDWIALFTRLGEDPAVARRLADQILDWRDTDTAPREFGYERLTPSQGVSDSPQNRPFLSVGELGRVRGITTARLNCLRPYVTAIGATRPPALDNLQGRDAATMDGLRVALRAELRRPNGIVDRRTALALFREEQRRPYHWVSFGDDRPEAGHCQTGAVEG